MTERPQAEAELERLAGEQAALRRVATLVAREASQAEVFTAIAEQVGLLLRTEEIRMLRFEHDRSAVVVGGSGEAEGVFAIGSRQPLGGDNAASRVFRTGRPARIDDYATASGAIAEIVQSIGLHSVVAAPIMVEGRLWGAMVTGTSRDEPLPPDTESRLGQFTELMATAIANIESHARADRLAGEQAALRRVATLVAQGVRPVEIFSAVSEEVGRLFGSNLASVGRFDAYGPAHVVVGVAHGVEGITVGSRWELDDAMAMAGVYRTGRAARVDGVDWSAVCASIGAPAQRLGSVSTVSCPIVVEGHLWGAISVSATEPLPLDADERLEKFTELVATAVGNADARAEVERLAEEQAALRRVATLVAEGASPAAVFDAVAAEMERLLDADHVTLGRYEPGAEVTTVAHRGPAPQRVPPGTRASHEGESVMSIVRRTERPARIDYCDAGHGAVADIARRMGIGVAVGAPIVVDGRVWGVIIAGWGDGESPPADTEERMAQFAQLLDTAIANAESRAQLMASRARLVAASDEARRRFERDLHDGVQQRLVSLALELHSAKAMAPRENEELIAQLTRVGGGLAAALEDVRELSRGIHPAILSKGGLVPALKTLARRSAVPVKLDLAVDEPLGDHVEAGAYYVVSEALTNTAKHAQASMVEVNARAGDGVLELTIGDDGVGGADAARGSGLTGLVDRVEALGGTIAIASPPGRGTSLRVELPVDRR